MATCAVTYRFWLLSAFLLGGCYYTAYSQKHNFSEPGIVDLIRWNPQKNGQITLRGEWEFYWKQLLYPEDFAQINKPKPDGWVSPPKIWNGMSISEKKLSGFGYATYRIKILLHKHSPGSLALKIHNFSTSARIFVNNTQVYEAGKVGTSPTETKPAFVPGIINIPSSEEKLEIIVQIANFHHAKGGFWKSIYLGSADFLHGQWEKYLYFEVFLLSSIFIMGLYNLAIFGMRKTEKTSLFFGLLCLFISLRITTTSTQILNDFFQIDWIWVSKLEHISFFLSALFFSWYLHSLFLKEFSRRILRVIEFMSLGYTLLTLGFSTWVYTEFLIGFQVFTLAICIYFTLIIIRGILHKVEGSWFFLAVWILFFVTIANDILFSLLWIRTSNLVEIGVFGFVLMQSLYLSIRFARVFIQSDILNQALQKANQNLELKVAQRKQVLGETHKQLSKMSAELQSINREVTDSILYAKRIQSSILPRIDRIREYLPAIFIFYRPKDLVSGDFYWFGVEQGKIILAVADCTGHGVPGALMSMVGNDLLSRIIHYQHITEPDQILNELDIQFRATLRQNHLENREGIDISLVVIDNDYTRLDFAGARSNLIFIHDQKLFTIEGDKHGIGAAYVNERKLFTKHRYEIERLTTFYLFSDGFADQFGGISGKKFLRKRFQKLLLDNSHVSLSKQESNIEKILEAWMAEYAANPRSNNQEMEQTDDITVIGFKL
ncbi:MAG: 7TM diverse intracellular signaling domain-containing protein [Microscillaceae bacterium]|nr:7TM diverse intracellular signaling domain-containing protein [Microscillaceae bacterium]